MTDRPEYAMGYVTFLVLFPKRPETNQDVSLSPIAGDQPMTQETTHATASG
jgi:hypothetical protein